MAQDDTPSTALEATDTVIVREGRPLWQKIAMGAVGLVAAVVFVKLIHSPLTHPAVNKAEVDYIESGGGLVRMEEASASNGAAFTWANVSPSQCSPIQAS